MLEMQERRGIATTIDGEEYTLYTGVVLVNERWGIVDGIFQTYEVVEFHGVRADGSTYPVAELNPCKVRFNHRLGNFVTESLYASPRDFITDDRFSVFINDVTAFEFTAQLEPDHARHEDLLRARRVRATVAPNAPSILHWSELQTGYQGVVWIVPDAEDE
jgi:hypothetical protein